jgi:putative two-component system response regulator
MISLTHHEKWDGSGYPNQLQGENIPLVGRIVTIVDVFDALNTKRPYKEAWPIENAFSYLQQESGRHFDAELVHLFSQVLPEIKEIIHCWSEESVTKEAICYG